jgi:hypothetical protein
MCRRKILLGSRGSTGSATTSGRRWTGLVGQARRYWGCKPKPPKSSSPEIYARVDWGGWSDETRL